MEEQTTNEVLDAASSEEDLALEADQQGDEAGGKKKTPAVYLAVVSSLSGDTNLVKATSFKELQELVKGLELGAEVCEVYRAIPKQFKVKTTVTKKLEFV